MSRPFGFLVCCGIGLMLGCFADQEALVDLFSNEPPVLHEINAPVTPPEGIPNADSCDVPPQPIQMDFPAYPEALRQKRVEGQVTLLFIIDSLGNQQEPQIAFATDSLFAQSVLQSFDKWKLAPAQIDGKPVTCYKRHTFEFVLGY
jgi:TonB family protein